MLWHSIIYNVLLCICSVMVSNVSADILSDNYGGDQARGPHPLMQMGPVHFQAPPQLRPARDHPALFTGDGSQPHGTTPHPHSTIRLPPPMPSVPN